MKEIRLFLDYKCYPIWIYDENGSLINNDLSEEIKNENDFEVDKKIVDLQNEYHHLFIDSIELLKYEGFDTEYGKKIYLEKFLSIERELMNKLGKNYIIKNEIKV